MRRCQTTRTLSQLNDTHFVPRVGALASPPGGGLQTGIAAEGRETPVATLAHSPGLTGDGERGADAWVALRHPRCLLHHAGTDNGSFAPLAGSDAGLKAPTGRTGRRSYYQSALLLDRRREFRSPGGERCRSEDRRSYSQSALLPDRRREFRSPGGERCRSEDRRSYYQSALLLDRRREFRSPGGERCRSEDRRSYYQSALLLDRRREFRSPGGERCRCEHRRSYSSRRSASFFSSSRRRASVSARRS